MTTELYIIMALIGIATFFMGFGFAHMSSTIKLGKQVEVNKAGIKGMEGNFKDERKRTDERIFEVISLVKSIIEQNGKIINQNTTLIAEINAQK